MADVSRVNPKKRGRGPDKKKRQTRSVTKKAKAQEKPQLKDAWTQTRPMTCVKFGKRTRQRLEVLEAKMLEINEPWVDRQLTLWVPVVKKTWTFLDKTLLYELFRDYNGSDLNAAGFERAVKRKERMKKALDENGRELYAKERDEAPIPFRRTLNRPVCGAPKFLRATIAEELKAEEADAKEHAEEEETKIDPLAQALQE